VKQLPQLGAGQVWCCAKGCGACGTKTVLREYSRTEHPNGDIESKSSCVEVSSCCAADLLLWDEEKKDFIEWSLIDEAGSEAVTVESCGDFMGNDMRKKIVASRPAIETLPAPAFRLPDGFDIHGLIDQCREAVRYWEPLQPFIDQFEKYMNCELCHGKCMVLDQSDAEEDFPQFDVAYVPCPKCNAVTQQFVDPFALRKSLKEAAINAIMLSGNSEHEHAKSLVSGAPEGRTQKDEASARAFLSIVELLSSAETKGEKAAMLSDLELFFKGAIADESTDQFDRAQAFRGLSQFESLRKHFQ
jgi:hypothetical protein